MVFSQSDIPMEGFDLEIRHFGAYRLVVPLLHRYAHK